MLKFEGVAKVGEFIKAMDFRPYEGRDDMFVIGKVAKIVQNDFEGQYAPAYMIDCVYDTEGVRVGQEVFVPFEVSYSDWDNRVQYVNEASARSIVSGR